MGFGDDTSPHINKGKKAGSEVERTIIEGALNESTSMVNHFPVSTHLLLYDKVLLGDDDEVLGDPATMTRRIDGCRRKSLSKEEDATCFVRAVIFGGGSGRLEFTAHMDNKDKVLARRSIRVQGHGFYVLTGGSAGNEIIALVDGKPVTIAHAYIPDGDARRVIEVATYHAKNPADRPALFQALTNNFANVLEKASAAAAAARTLRLKSVDEVQAALDVLPLHFHSEPCVGCEGKKELVARTLVAKSGTPFDTCASCFDKSPGKYTTRKWCMDCGFKLREEGIARCLGCNICANFSSCGNKRDCTNSLCLSCLKEQPCAKPSCPNTRKGTNSLCLSCTKEEADASTDGSVQLGVGESQFGRVRTPKVRFADTQALTAKLRDYTKEGLAKKAKISM
jgi:hypothetical protein